MAIICNRYLSTRQFNYQSDTKCFVTEASDLGVAVPVDRVYDDACDVGFVLVSQVTGISILFVQDGVDMDGEDVAGWRYKAAKISGTRPATWLDIPLDFAKFTALIIND